MSADVHSIADDQVRSAFKRWQNLEEEKARVADDLKELFAEQKALGHDTKAMRAAFRLKVKLDEADPAEVEHEALVDTYLAALDAPRASRACTREKIEQFDANPRLIKQVVDGIQSEAGKAALLTVINIMTDREEAEEITSSDGYSTVSCELTTRSPEASVVPHSEKATVATQGEATAPTSDEREGCDVANAGGNDVDRNAERVPTSNTGEGTALSALPAKPKHALRPHCLNPGPTCGGSGPDHCWTCKKAAAEKREDAA